MIDMHFVLGFTFWLREAVFLEERLNAKRLVSPNQIDQTFRSNYPFDSHHSCSIVANAFMEQITEVICETALPRFCGPLQNRELLESFSQMPMG